MIIVGKFLCKRKYKWKKKGENVKGVCFSEILVPTYVPIRLHDP
jgi:hypothetical protein